MNWISLEIKGYKNPLIGFIFLQCISKSSRAVIDLVYEMYKLNE